VVTFTGPTPEVAGHRAATLSLARFASALPSGCSPTEERSDPHLVSVAWRCGGRIAATTVTLDGKTLALADFMTGAYQGYLSAVAQQQFQVEGVKGAATTDLSTWYLTPATLAVVYPAGVVTYPLASLAAYLRDASSL
jgi:hypothetical protein